MTLTGLCEILCILIISGEGWKVYVSVSISSMVVERTISWPWAVTRAAYLWAPSILTRLSCVTCWCMISVDSTVEIITVTVVSVQAFGCMTIGIWNRLEASRSFTH